MLERMTAARWLALGLVAAGWRVHPVAGGIVAVALYAVACWWYPVAACLCCNGSGKHRSTSGKTWRPCRHWWWPDCHGKGSRQRIGNRLWHYFA